MPARYTRSARGAIALRRCSTILFAKNWWSVPEVSPWDGIGFWLYYRRLEQGTFEWPPVSEAGSIELTHAQLTVLTQGLDWRRVRIAQQLEPSIA